MALSKPKARGLQVVSTHHWTEGSIALSLEEYIRVFVNDSEQFLTQNATKTARGKWVSDRYKKEQSKYFVVTLVECDPKGARWLGSPVMTRELKIWRRSNPPAEGMVHLDAVSLREVRDHNNSGLDDTDGTEVAGRYDLYVRRVRWYDIRHWLVHPNREIRIAVWVTLISTVVPPILDALFG